MSSTLAMAVGALVATSVVAVIMVWYLEMRLKSVVFHLEELYGQLEALLWRLEN